MTKLFVEAEVRQEKSRDINRYKGRFIGFLKDDEFNSLVQNSIGLGGRIETKETKELMKLAATLPNLLGCRLVMTIRQKNGKEVYGKRLLVSGKLDYVSEVSPADKRVKFVTAAGGDFIVTEGEEK